MTEIKARENLELRGEEEGIQIGEIFVKYPEIRLCIELNNLGDFTQTWELTKHRPPDIEVKRIIAKHPEGDIYNPGVAVIGTRIYLLGGLDYNSSESPLEFTYSGTICIFDTLINEWVTDPPIGSLLEPRGLPAAVPYGNVIYVFGGFGPSRDQWLEGYNVRSAKSKYFPCPPQEVTMADQISSYVLHNDTVFFFFNQLPNIHCYSITKCHWYTLQTPDLTIPEFQVYHFEWSNSIVIIRSYILWHYCGSIYMYDYTNPTNNAKPICLLTLPKHRCFYDFMRGYRSFLVDLGNNKLCLVYADHVTVPSADENDYFHNICFHWIKVSFSRPPITLELEENDTFHRVLDAGIMDVLVMNSSGAQSGTSSYRSST